MSSDTNLRLDAFLPYRLSVATNRVSDLVASAYRRLFGINIPEWRLIAVLAERGELNQQGLGQATRMDKLAVSRAAAGLDKRGLIERRTDARDRRNQRLTLSAEGRKLYAAVAPEALAIEARLFASFSPDRRDTLLAMLGEIEAAADALAAGRGEKAE